MNPEIEALNRRITELEQAQNLNAINSLLQVIIKDAPTVTDADVTLTVSDTVGPDGGTVSVDVLDFPDRWIELRYKGEIYRLPAYLKRLDSAR